MPYVTGMYPVSTSEHTVDHMIVTCCESQKHRENDAASEAASSGYSRLEQSVLVLTLCLMALKFDLLGKPICCNFLIRRIGGSLGPARHDGAETEANHLR